MEDREIVELYWARSQEAIGETERKYGRYCMYIAQRILGDGEDAREAVNDAYMRLWTSIPPARPESLKAYLGAVCRNLALDARQSKDAKQRGGEAELIAEEISECAVGIETDMEEGAALRDALNGFLESVPARTRVIFLRRYWYACPVREIAGELGMKESAVAMALSRTRRKLRKYLEKEGFYIDR